MKPFIYQYQLNHPALIERFMANVMHIKTVIGSLGNFLVEQHGMYQESMNLKYSAFFPEKGDGILSIDTIKMCENTIQADVIFNSLVHIPQEIVQLTCITNNQMKEAPNLSDVLIKFLPLKQDCTLVAYPANHERNVMQYESSKLFLIPFKH
ncbi:hypothetical protein JFL43_02950 [Viridibacillus sp. YIM B01967]|uniref:Uncharacterized protein n=1 Tax=Viridibacillus soli TaxID=2798301 RepID=A0ABS1H449_9BACL|nr:hypothetical protein [Viridibacillus soli]MBK3493833.1 hypothetical protein [Viridibacillus soli]